MTKEQVQCFKGVGAALVILHHVLQDAFVQKLVVKGGILATLAIEVIQSCGFFAVAFFFFLSGYGLRQSYDLKGCRYGHGLLKTRIIPFYGIVLFVALMYLVEFLLVGMKVSLSDFMRTFGLGGTIIIKGWFLQAIILFYGLFWLFSYLPELAFRKLGGFFIVFTYVSICKFMNLPSYWYHGAFAFAIGFYWQSIDAIKGKGVRVWLFAGIGVIVCRVGVWYCNHIVGGWGWFLMIFYLAAVTLLFFESMARVNVKNRVTLWFGGISFELYCCQGLFLVLFSRWSSEHGVYFCFFVFICSLLFARILHPIFQFILKHSRNLTGRIA